MQKRNFNVRLRHFKNECKLYCVIYIRVSPYIGLRIKYVFATYVDHLSRRLPTALHICLCLYMHKMCAHKAKVGNLSNDVSRSGRYFVRGSRDSYKRRQIFALITKTSSIHISRIDFAAHMSLIKVTHLLSHETRN